MHHERIKHIDIRYHFVRDIISEAKIFVKKISTKKNQTDMLTKSLSIENFKFCRNSMTVCC
jgi:hypothetical protein